MSKSDAWTKFVAISEYSTPSSYHGFLSFRYSDIWWLKAIAQCRYSTDCLLVSQVFPINPFKHVHLNLLPRSTQEPPFLHGPPLHMSISEKEKYGKWYEIFKLIFKMTSLFNKAVWHTERCWKQSYSSHFQEVFWFFSLLISFHVFRNEFLKFRLKISEFVKTLAAIIW